MMTWEEAREFMLRKTGSEPIKAYKMFDFVDDMILPAFETTGRYKAEHVHHVDGPLVVCKNGYHACPDITHLPTHAPWREHPVQVREVLIGDYIRDQYESQVVGRYLYVGPLVTDHYKLYDANKNQWNISNGIGSWLSSPRSQVSRGTGRRLSVPLVSNFSGGMGFSASLYWF